MSIANNFPTLDSLRASRTPVFSSMDMLRIRWKPFGPLQSTIEVADDLAAGPNSSVSPYQLTIGVNPSFHEISTSPATDPPVSSITVTISDLEDWDWRWAENHEDCWEGYDNGHQEWIEEDRDENDEEDDDDPPRKLMRCCNENRPQAPQPLLVRPIANDFITVHDYISQVHPWIENLQVDIVAATKENAGTHPSTPRYMTLLRLDAPKVRDDHHGRGDSHWKSVAEHAQLRRDGRMIGRSHTYEETTPLVGRGNRF
jgi:hypothetical protein